MTTAPSLRGGGTSSRERKPALSFSVEWLTRPKDKRESPETLHFFEAPGALSSSSPTARSEVVWFLAFLPEQEADWTGSFFYLGHWRFLRRGTTRIRSSSIQPLPFYLTEEGGSPINETLIHQWRGLETSISLATRRDARDPLTNELRRGGNQWMHPSTLAIRDLCYGPTGWFDWRGTLGSG